MGIVCSPLKNNIQDLAAAGFFHFWLPSGGLFYSPHPERTHSKYEGAKCPNLFPVPPRRQAL